MATLLYKKWRIEDCKLVLTAISLGAHTRSVSDEKYVIKSLKHNRVLLEKKGIEYSYKKVNRTIEIDTSYIASLSTSFDYFPVDVIDVSEIASTKHPIDFKSNPKATRFKTVISQEYSATSENFGAYYIIAVWGCGTGCLEGVMIDTRDGKVYSLPTKKGYIDFGANIENYSKSILLKTFITYTIDGSTKEVEISSWLWNESSKEFVNYTNSNKIIKE